MYTLCFFVTCFLTYIGNKLVLKKNIRTRKLGRLLFLIVVIIFAVIAGLRDFTVGTDIGFYGSPSFNEAKRFSFREYWKIDSDKLEPGYLILTYIFANTIGYARVWFGVIEFIIAGFTVARLYDIRETGKMWVGMCIFNCIILPPSLNIMRQSMAMAITFYASRYVLVETKAKPQYIRFLIYILVACSFHVTAAIGLVIPLYRIYFRTDHTHLKAKDFVRSLVLILLLLIAVVSIDKIVNIIIPLSSFTRKFSRYAGLQRSGFSINPMLIRFPFIVLICLFWKQYYSKRNYLLFMLLVTEALFAEMRIYSTTLYRLALYFSFYRLLAMPILIGRLNKENRKLVELAVVLLCFVTWFYQIVLQGNEEVFPYTMDWLWE